ATFGISMAMTTCVGLVEIIISSGDGRPAGGIWTGDMASSPSSRRKAGRRQRALQNTKRSPHNVRLGAARVPEKQARLPHAVVIAEPPDENCERHGLVG